MIRRNFLIIIFFTVWAVLLKRIFNITITGRNKYDKLAHKNYIRKDYIVPIRGEIYDRNGKSLAINKFGFKISIKPKLTLKKSTVPALMDDLKYIVKYLPEYKVKDLYKKYKSKDSHYNYDNIVVIPFIDYDSVLSIYSYLNFKKNIRVESSSQRYYPYKEVAAHVIGYVSHANSRNEAEDIITKYTGVAGKTGIEKYYNSYLQGELGEKIVKIGAYNQLIDVLGYKKPVSNRNIFLNIDLDLQKHISKIFEGHSGSMVVLGTKGELMAAGSYPEYDLNAFVNGINQKDWNRMQLDINVPFTNKIVNGLYPPASVIKMGVALAYITNKKVGPNKKFVCKGFIIVGKRRFRCWKLSGHGVVNVVKSLRESCDVFYYKGGLLTGVNYIAKKLKRYGLSVKTGVDLPNEFIGIVPDKKWKLNKYKQPWYIGETLNTAIGQGSFLVTPMQMARYTALFASKKLLTPTLIRKKGEVFIPLKEPVDVFTKEEKKKVKIVEEGLREVVQNNRGTLHREFVGTNDISGKSGTAQVVSIPQSLKNKLRRDQVKYLQRPHGWSSIYFPDKNPRYVSTILVEHIGSGSKSGFLNKSVYDKMKSLGYNV